MPVSIQERNMEESEGSVYDGLLQHIEGKDLKNLNVCPGLAGASSTATICDIFHNRLLYGPTVIQTRPRPLFPRCFNMFHSSTLLQ